eukprot:NODE_6920_length_428_cov_71.812665_g5311_i0.p3 GENE.NODE_6920_length_428_cov_71.812665_g5311_i0~~NODE_6920_length_428_cov_71.812665_g5311_i0.p3  ORF type:complete len:54 (-),score=5.31 NODE_6920_length_428_cov_71.812665_g5311_i0:33-194(-)
MYVCCLQVQPTATRILPSSSSSPPPVVHTLANLRAKPARGLAAGKNQDTTSCT